MTRLKPKDQEDWRAIYWMHAWGVPLSETQRIIMHHQEGFTYMWHVPKGEENGVQQEQSDGAKANTNS